jgi:hypothetical protein
MLHRWAMTILTGQGKNAELTVFHLWDDSMAGISAHSNEKNELSDLPYSGIAAWRGCDNFRIRENKVHSVMKLLNDGGGIYVTGNTGGQITCNQVYDIREKEEDPDNKRHGIYPDEKTSNCVVESNLVYGCPSAVLNHMSDGNTIRNNVFVSTEGPVKLSFIRCQKYVIEKNAIQARDEITFLHRQDAFAVFDENLLYSGINRIESVFVADDYSCGKPTKLDTGIRQKKQ